MKFYSHRCSNPTASKLSIDYARKFIRPRSIYEFNELEKKRATNNPVGFCRFVEYLSAVYNVKELQLNLSSVRMPSCVPNRWTRIPFYRRDAGVRDRILVGPSRGPREAILGAEGRDSLSSRYTRGRAEANCSAGRTREKGGWEDREEEREDGVLALKKRARIA